MWTYFSRTGELLDPSGQVTGLGYSGNGAGLNNPGMQDIHDQGPIPEGMWTIEGFFDDPGGKGPIVAHLQPEDVTETYGRSGFMIHGDNSEGNHTASEGCIILPRQLREMIAASGDTSLEVRA